MVSPYSPMRRGINRSSLPAGGGAEDAYRALSLSLRCHGANKYRPIDRRVREEEEEEEGKKKKATGAAV